MCGVWGFITTETARGKIGRSKFVQQAAVVGSVRGYDSTGVIVVPHNLEGPAGLTKTVGTGIDFLCNKDAVAPLDVSTMHEMRALLGHNRAATQGKVTLANAHPFQEGPITLVHNGTLAYTGSLPTSMHEMRRQKVEVDSHLLCHNLALHERKAVLESIDGAFTLIWHDGRDNCIYMARNNQRPLYLMRLKDEDTVVYASEADMLWWLAGRVNMARDTIYSLDPGVLLQFSPNTTKPKSSKFTVYTPPATVGWTGYNRGGNWAGKTSTPPSKGTPTQLGGVRTTKKARGALKFMGFDHQTDMELAVEQVLPVLGTTRAVVTGHVYYKVGTGATQSIMGILYGLDMTYAHENRMRDWVVRPVGVKMVGPKGKEVEALVCRLQSVSAPSYKHVEYSGPGNSKVTASEWMVATVGGCLQCSGALTLSQHEDILWVDGDRPICPKCAYIWREDGAAGTRGVCI